MKTIKMSPNSTNGNDRYLTIGTITTNKRFIGASTPITGKMFGEQKSDTPKTEPAAKEITKRIKNKVVPL
jgi:hypothetical protein